MTRCQWMVLFDGSICWHLCELILSNYAVWHLFYFSPMLFSRCNIALLFKHFLTMTKIDGRESFLVAFYCLRNEINYLNLFKINRNNSSSFWCLHMQLFSIFHLVQEHTHKSTRMGEVDDYFKAKWNSRKNVSLMKQYKSSFYPGKNRHRNRWFVRQLSYQFLHSTDYLRVSFSSVFPILNPIQLIR